MIKLPLKVRAEVGAEGKRLALCPKCNRVVELHDFSSKTGLYYKSIHCRNFHNRKFSLCPDCKTCFEVSE